VVVVVVVPQQSALMAQVLEEVLEAQGHPLLLEQVVRLFMLAAAAAALF